MPSDASKAVNLLTNLIKLPFTNPRGLREVCGVALSVVENVKDADADVLPIPAVTLQELVAEAREPMPLRVCAFPQEPHSISVVEAFALSLLMRKVNARRAFEIGTHRGVSTTQLASNIPEDGELFTLDLPREDRRTHFEVEHVGDQEVLNIQTKADLIPAELRSRIRFLEQDSALFDPTPYASSMDFVFVDGAHNTIYVKNDSEKAWTMAKPGGIVAWHDCRPQTPDVVRYLLECPYSPRRILGGTIAFAVKR